MALSDGKPKYNIQYQQKNITNELRFQLFITSFYIPLF